MITPSKTVVSMSSSETVKLLDKSLLLKSQGLDVISFGAGEPDFDTPLHIVEAGKRSMNSGFTHYTSSRGIPKLREAIASKLHKDNGVDVDPDKEIIVTTGCKTAIFISLMALLNPGDEVLYFEPAWVSYAPLIQLASGKAIPIQLDWKTNFGIDDIQLEQAITPRSKAIIINSPNNPTGQIHSLDDLKVVERLANKYDLFVISDEIYEGITFDGEKMISPASFPGLASRTLTTSGFSKTYAMTGWRLGYVAGLEALISPILKVQQQVVTCATSFVQEAGVAALEGPHEPILEMVMEYQRRRDFIANALHEMPGVWCLRPKGAFYIFPRFDGVDGHSQDFADNLLEKELVVATPGVAFGAAGEGHLRFSFACSMSEIEKGMARLKLFIESF